MNHFIGGTLEIPVCNTCNSSRPNSYVLVCTECASKINESQTTDTQQLKAEIAEEMYCLSGADIDMPENVRLKIRKWYRQLSAV